MVLLAALLLVLYNALFFWHRHLPDFLAGLIQPIGRFIEEHHTALTVLEVVGVVALFVDLVLTYDKQESQLKRRLWTIVIGLLGMAFVFKLYINYLDSALMA